MAEFGSARSASLADDMEVSIQDFSTTSAYKNPSQTKIYRTKDSALAYRLSRLMIQACDNNNLRYSQGLRTQIYKNHIDASIITFCDCSSLVAECIMEASGLKNINFTTYSIGDALLPTGLFYAVQYVSLSQTPVYPGDIVNRRVGGADGYGHVGIITSSTVGRSGEEAYDEAYIASTDSGEVQTFEWADFTPRTTAPVLSPRPKPIYKKDKKGKKYLAGYEEDVRDLWYVSINDEVPGHNPFDELNEESYIWCRFSEIMNNSCALGMGALGSLYAHKEDGYARNVAAGLGSIMCFSKPRTRGWAGIVESIDPGGSVLLSSYSSTGQFQLTTLTKRYGIWDFNGYKFQGFIHNPGVSLIAIAKSAKETFIQVAEDQVGSDSEWTFNYVNTISDNNGWSAAFVTACSARAGSSLNIVIPNVVSCSAIGRAGVLRNMGTWYPGPAQGKFVLPESGDIVLFRNGLNLKGMSTYDADHAGIVSSTNGTKLTVIEGDCGGKVQQNDYSASCNQISGYFRPNWDLIDGTSDSVNQYRDMQGLYTEGTTIQDACAREVGYLNSNFKPSIVSSKLRLSVINYTGLLSNMYTVFAQTTVSDAAKSELVVDLWTNTIRSYYQVDGVDFDSVASGLDDMFGVNLANGYMDSTGTEVIPEIVVDVVANARAAYAHLISKGFCPAAVCGVLGNIKAESNFRTNAQGDKIDGKYTSFGICQWHNNKKSGYTEGRGANMKAFCGPNWYNNLTGQLDFLVNELKNYNPTLSAMRNCPNTKAGAKYVADKFVRDFERPANVDEESKKRQANAASYWDQLVN